MPNMHVCITLSFKRIENMGSGKKNPRIRPCHVSTGTRKGTCAEMLLSQK